MRHPTDAVQGLEIVNALRRIREGGATDGGSSVSPRNIRRAR
jgi:hypothetical protein